MLPKDIQCIGHELSLMGCSREYDSTECNQLAGVICEAPCLSNGTNECNECSSQTDCPLIPNDLCYCSSECYSSGLCCSDVGYLKNCLGEIIGERITSYLFLHGVFSFRR